MHVSLPEPLQTFAANLFRAMGAGPEIAAEVAGHLVRANLSGHDSHGVIRIPQYVKDADRGDLVAGARPTMVHETPVTAVIDAHRGFGQYSTLFALDWAVPRARRHGLAAAAVRHSMHIGRLGEYTERAAAGGLIAAVTAGLAGPGIGAMAAFGGTGRFLGTNPWSVGVPGANRSMIFDAATSVVAEGKVRVALAKNAPLPPGCLVDRNGTPTRAPADYYSGGALTPLGGEVAGHKGYGLALAAALIGGLCMIDDADPTRIGAPSPERPSGPRSWMGGVFLLVVDPAAFGDADHYRAMVDETLGAAKRMPPAPGRDAVLLPGEPEALSRTVRAARGIELPEATWKDLTALAERFDVPLPRARPAE